MDDYQGFNGTNATTTSSIMRTGNESGPSHYLNNMPPSNQILSDEIADQAYNVIFYIRFPPLSVMGFINNILTIIVFYKMGYKETANISMTAIAVCDLFACSFIILISMVRPIRWLFPPFNITWSTIIAIYLGPVMTMAIMSSIMLSVFMGVQRCLCVSLPFTVKHILTRKFVTIASFSIPVVIVILFIPRYFIDIATKIVHPPTNKTIFIQTKTRFSMENPEMWDYLLTLAYIFPFTCVIVNVICASIILYHLKKATKVRSGLNDSMQGNSKDTGGLSVRDRKVMRTLLVILAVYIVSFFPNTVYYFMLFAIDDGPGSPYMNIIRLYHEINNIFLTVNFSTNFFIFYNMSNQFKETFRAMFKRS